MTLLRSPTRVSTAADRSASCGNETISSTRPSCWIQISTVDVVNIAADHQMFMTLKGELRWQCLRRSADDFYSKTEKKSLLSHPLGDLKVTYALHLWLVGKPVVNFVFVVIELFSLSLTDETLWAEIGRRGGVTLSADFRGNGASPTNQCWCQKTRVIAVSRVKISAAHHLVLSQYTHLTDRRTEFRQQHRALHYMQSHGKSPGLTDGKARLEYSRIWNKKRYAWIA